MRRGFSVLAVVPFVTFVAVACDPAARENEASEFAQSTSEALTRVDVADGPGRVVKPQPPVTPPKDAGTKPPIHLGLGLGTANVGSLQVSVEPTPYCGTYQFDLRRTTRVCEDLPGAYVDGGFTWVPGANGRFKVLRTLASTNAPAVMQEKSCTYIWESTSCKKPEMALLLESFPAEQLIPRLPGCTYLESKCGMDSPLPDMGDSGGIPNGIGHCEVCGYASDNVMWAVLPTDWATFSYNVGGVRTSVTLNRSQPIYQVTLPANVPPSTVSIWYADAAP